MGTQSIQASQVVMHLIVFENSKFVKLKVHYLYFTIAVFPCFQKKKVSGLSLPDTLLWCYTAIIMLLWVSSPVSCASLIGSFLFIFWSVFIKHQQDQLLWRKPWIFTKQSVWALIQLCCDTRNAGIRIWRSTDWHIQKNPGSTFTTIHLFPQWTTA